MSCGPPSETNLRGTTMTLVNVRDREPVVTINITNNNSTCNSSNNGANKIKVLLLLIVNVVVIVKSTNIRTIDNTIYGLFISNTINIVILLYYY